MLVLAVKMAAVVECNVVMVVTESELLGDKEVKREAESFKEQENAYCAKKDDSRIYDYYTKAIEIRPKNASKYGNRVTTLMMLRGSEKLLKMHSEVGWQFPLGTS